MMYVLAYFIRVPSQNVPHVCFVDYCDRGVLNSVVVSEIPIVGECKIRNSNLTGKKSRRHT